MENGAWTHLFSPVAWSFEAREPIIQQFFVEPNS
jgi:hypothetical protein